MKTRIYFGVKIFIYTPVTLCHFIISLVRMVFPALCYSKINWNLSLITSFSCMVSSRVSLSALLAFHQYITYKAQSVCHPHAALATICLTFRKKWLLSSPIFLKIKPKVVISRWFCLFFYITFRNSFLNSDRNHILVTIKLCTHFIKIRLFLHELNTKDFYMKINS